ncbi:MAG TPA: lysophospholipid acyltransferase family protein [Planctomycetota bacterium]|nr:lysophospholipid acyltransferase family protein [Planctomycetota bacterium]
MKSFRVSPLHPAGPLEAAGYWLCRGVFQLALRTKWHLSLADVRELPEGPIILAANHRSFIDPLVLGSAVERRVTFMMTARYYDLPMLNWFFRMSRCIVVDDEKPDNRKALRDSLESLEAGQVVAIFPEGHISPDGSLQPAQPGMGWLARKSGAPVYPVWLGGTREVLTKGERRLRPSHVVVRMGAPHRAADFGDGRDAGSALTEAVMTDIARLGGVKPAG